MSRTYHTPIPFHTALNEATVNSPLGDLDAAIDAILTGDADWLDYVTAPPLPSGSDVLLFFMNNLLQMRDVTGVTPITPATVGYIQNFALYATGLTMTAAGWTSYAPGFEYAHDGTGLAWIEIAFTLGNTEPQIDDVLVSGGGLGSYGTVAATPVVTVGSWAGGDAEGTILLKDTTRTVSDGMSGLVDIQGGAANVLTVSVNKISVPSGKYRIRAWGSSTDSDGLKLRLYDHTAAAALLYGTSEFSSSAASGLRPKSWINGIFTLTQRATLSIDMYRQTVSGDLYQAGRYPSWYAAEYAAIYHGFELWRYPTT